MIMCQIIKPNFCHTSACCSRHFTFLQAFRPTDGLTPEHQVTAHLTAFWNRRFKVAEKRKWLSDGATSDGYYNDFLDCKYRAWFDSNLVMRKKLEDASFSGNCQSILICCHLGRVQFFVWLDFRMYIRIVLIRNSSHVQRDHMLF